MINNPYIEKVKNHPKIFCDQEKIFLNKGKWSEYFGNDKEIYLEIGTGLGNFFSREASKNMDKNFIGMEIRYKRLFKTAEKSIDLGVTDFCVLKEYGEKIPQIFRESEVSRVYIHFPDPWARKERQLKNRLFSENFISDLYNILKPGGKIFFKTDHREYFLTTLELFKKNGGFKQVFKSDDYREEEFFDKTNITEFEQIFRGQDLKIGYVEFEK